MYAQRLLERTRRLVALLFGLAILPVCGLAAEPSYNAHEQAIALMADDPTRAEQFLNHPTTNAERLDYALFLHAFHDASEQRDDKIRALLKPLEAEISSGNHWGMALIGTITHYDGSDASLIPIITAASVSGVANTQSSFYAIPCAILERRPGLLVATKPRYGGNGDNFVPRNGCQWGRGSVAGFPEAAVETFLADAAIAGGFGRAGPRGTIWYTIWARKNVTRARMMLDPGTFLSRSRSPIDLPAAPPIDYPYQNWAYLSLANHALVTRLRESHGQALRRLDEFYQARGLVPEDARQAASAALLIVPFGAGCGGARPPASLRVLIMDGASVAQIQAFISSGQWDDPSLLSSIRECAKHGGIEPLAHVAIRDSAIFQLVRQLADRVPQSRHRELDLDVGVDSTNSFGKTPLMTAAQFDLVASARFLLDRGAGVNDATIEGALHFDKRTALHYAAASGSLTMIRLLLAHGADPSAQDAAGRPLGYYLKGRSSTGGLRPIDYLEGRGPVPPNPRLSDEDRAEAVELLSRSRDLLGGTPGQARRRRERSG